ncbi:MAG: rhodanese-like domain-containing protein [Bradymonadales bacterium]|nr:MAG: rhodanese-like domain-containing protein [Bradymonadales bacterium]
MFGNSQFRQEVLAKFREVEQQIADLQRTQSELKSQNTRLTHQLKTVTRKLVMRLPLSLESLEKALNYDLIFPEELESWKKMTQGGLLVDIRSAEEFSKSSIPDAISMPIDQLGKQVERLSKFQPILLICENGVKSVSASELLHSKGFHFLYVLKGGISHFSGKTVTTGLAGEFESQVQQA